MTKESNEITTIGEFKLARKEGKYILIIRRPGTMDKIHTLPYKCGFGHTQEERYNNLPNDSEIPRNKNAKQRYFVYKTTEEAYKKYYQRHKKIEPCGYIPYCRFCLGEKRDQWLNEHKC